MYSEIKHASQKQLFLLAGGSILILLSIAFARRAMPYSPALTHDSVSYINGAENLANAGRLEVDIVTAVSVKPVSDLRAFVPGYSLMIALLLMLGIGIDASLYTLTLLMLVVLVTLVYILTWRLTNSFLTAIVAGIWVLTFLPILDLMTYALSESLFVPLSVGVLLVAARYLQTEKPSVKTLTLLGILLAAAPLVRYVGVALAPAVGIVFVIHSLKIHRWRSALIESSVSVISLVPIAFLFALNYFFAGCLLCGGTPGVEVPLMSRCWLASLLLSQFAPHLSLSLGLGYQRQLISFLSGYRIVSIIVLALICLIGASVFWRIRKILLAMKPRVGWALWPIIVYLAIYLGFFFGTGLGGEMNFPRYLIPTYPLIIVLVVAVGHGLYVQVPSRLFRGTVLLVLLGYLAGNLQATTNFILTAREGRGIEAPEVRGHPAIAYVRQNLREQDLVFSTKAPTLWYYLRRPMRRLDAVKTLRCQQLPQPPVGGRSIFVLFPFYVYDGDPAAPGDIAWFEQWAGECGTIVDAQVLGDTAAYIVEPKQP